MLDSLGIAVSTGGFGLVCGLASHNAGFPLLATQAMSLFLFAGAAQFATIGYVAQHVPWATILVLTALLNARHLLYSASLATELGDVPRGRRALMAQVLTDETFALSSSHFRRTGRADEAGYWLAALVGCLVPYNLGTLVGSLVGAAVPSPQRFGIDVVFPAAMAGLAVGLVTSRRELVAAGAGAALAVGASLAFGPGVGIVAGGLLGPLAAVALPLGPRRKSRR